VRIPQILPHYPADRCLRSPEARLAGSQDGNFRASDAIRPKGMRGRRNPGFLEVLEMTLRRLRPAQAASR
jgi:hypothetical protein